MVDYETDFHPEPRSVRLRRRLKTIPRDVGLLVVLTLLAPVLATVALTVDLVRWLVRRTPFVAIRLLAFAWVFLASSALGLVRFALSWVAAGFGTDRRRLVDSAWPIQVWWADTLLRTVMGLFSMKLEVEGEDVIVPGPILAMFRHASIVDNLLPTVLLTKGQGIKLRWIIKRELINYPALDVGGHRLPNYFVDRDSTDTRNEIAQIRKLAEDLGPDEGVMIYPEGTRFTEQKLARARERLASSSHLAERSQTLRHVLPPRIGGPLILLDSGVDVVVGAHVGLGGFASIGDIWAGGLVGRTIRVKMWRIAAQDIPSDRSERIDWLFDQWQAIDDWIEEHVD